MHISPYAQGTHYNHVSDRERKLLHHVLMWSPLLPDSRARVRLFVVSHVDTFSELPKMTNSMRAFLKIRRISNRRNHISPSVYYIGCLKVAWISNVFFLNLATDRYQHACLLNLLSDFSTVYLPVQTKCLFYPQSLETIRCFAHFFTRCSAFSRWQPEIDRIAQNRKTYTTGSEM